MIGAQYVWTAQFAPRRFRLFATFIQGMRNHNHRCVTEHHTNISTGRLAYHPCMAGESRFNILKIGARLRMTKPETDIASAQSVVPALAYLAASQIRGVIILLAPAYGPQDWHVCLIMIVLLLFSCMAAILWKRSLPMVAILVAVLYFLVFFAILATVLARGHYASSSFVWQNNQSFYTGDMPGVSYCVGFVTMAVIFTG